MGKKQDVQKARFWRKMMQEPGEGDFCRERRLGVRAVARSIPRPALQNAAQPPSARRE